MGQLKLTVFSAIIILIIATTLPLGYAISATSTKDPLRHPCMGGEMSPGTVYLKKNTPHSSPFAPTKARAGGKIPFSCNFIFQSDIVRNLQGIRSGERRRISGIHQIFHRNALENGNRRIIYDIIIKNPGIDQAGIATLTGLNNQTLRYHLGVLISFHKVTAERGGAALRFFENGGALTDMERQLDAHMRSLTARSIMHLINETPDINQVRIASTLRVTPPAVIWHIRKLTRDGLVKEERRGNTVHYTMTPEGTEVYEKFVDQATAANLATFPHSTEI